jgi:hypothetical protein
MAEYEIAILKALKDGTWRDRKYLKAEQTRATGYEYHDYTNLMRNLEDKKLVVMREAERTPGSCWYEYQITKAGVQALDQA